nr:MAG TPA: hypothetical protein [Bacteriophage sp.]
MGSFRPFQRSIISQTDLYIYVTYRSVTATCKNLSTD